MQFLDEDQLKGFKKASVICSLDLDSSIFDVDQCNYAMSLLHLATLLSSKLSIVLLLRMTSPSATHQRLGLVTGCFMIVWAMVTGFVSAFQCKAPEIWNFAQDNCIDGVSCSL